MVGLFGWICPWVVAALWSAVTPHRPEGSLRFLSECAMMKLPIADF